MVNKDSQSPGQTDPFSSKALSISQARLMTDEDERNAVAPEVRHLSEQGYVIVPGVISGQELEQVRQALDVINEQTRWGIHEFEGYRTHRAYCLAAQTAAFDPLIMNRQVLAIIESYFGEPPQLSASMGITIYEGQAAQPLHRDSGHYPLPWPHPPLEVNAIWAFDDFTAGNGATRYLPATHRVADENQPEGEVRVAEMSAGSVLIYDGAMWHGGGASTEPGARRRCINNLYTRQWLRQQDNMYLALDTERVLAAPPLMQRLLGYWIYGTTLGVLNGEAPIKTLRERSSGTESGA